jgi:integrase
MASISKRNGKYHVRVRKQGIPTQCRAFINKRDAVRWAADTERAADNGHIVTVDCTIGELLNRYEREISSKKRGWKVESYRLNTLRKSDLVEIKTSKLKPIHIARYRDDRLKKVTPASVKRELVILSHMISVAMTDWGYDLPANPCHRVRKPSVDNARDRRLIDDDFDRLISSCKHSDNAYLAPLVEFAIETAMRRGELLSLRWSDVHVDQSYCHLPLTKNGSSRDVPLSMRAKALLEDLPKDSELVIPIHFEALKGLWKRAMKRAGIDDLHFHDLRHEATSRFFEKGLNVMEVAAITGHKDLRMLQRYTHLKASDLALKLSKTCES